MPTFQRNPLTLELALLFLLALLWGGSYPLIKLAVADIPPVTLIAVRVSIAAVFLFFVLWFRNERLPKAWADWRRLLVQSFLNSIGAWTILAWGQQYVESSLASVLNSTSPLFVFILTLVVTRHETAGTLKFIGASIGFTGVVLIIGTEALAGLGQQLAGQLAALAGAFLYALAAIYGRHFTHLPPTVTAAGTMIWASVVLIPAALVLERPFDITPSATAMVAALVLSVFCTGVALLIYFRLVRTLGSLGVASQAYLRAAVGVLIGIFVLGEKLTPMIFLGLAAALIGVALMNWPVSGRHGSRTG